jgi:hypothetical protein
MPKIPRGERARARQLILELYMAGFTPQEIEELTGARWKSNTIVKYCRGLEVKDTSEKDKAMSLLKEFIQRKGNWEELEFYVETKKALNSEGWDINDLIEQKKEMDKYDVDLEMVGAINAMLRNQDAKWDWFLEYYKLVVDVIKLDYTFPGLELLKEKTLELGGIEATIKTITHVITEAQSQELANKFKKQMDALDEEYRAEERRLEEVMHQIKLKQSLVDYANQLLYQYKLDPIALQTIITLAQKLGEPT